MECLNYCLRCFRDVENWDKLVVSELFIAVRCPFCQAVHSLYPDGSVRLQTKSGGG